MSVESTKSRILSAALKLLEESGIKNVTQPAVAKLVGIPQGQLTYHFKHRADLILAVTESALDGVSEYLWKNHPEMASQSFSKLVGIVLELMKSETRVRALLGLIAEADESPEVLKRLLNQGKKVRSLISAALQMEEESAEVTISHAVMLGFAVMLFLQNDKSKRKLLEEHFRAAVQILTKHIQDKKSKKTKKGKR